MVFEINWNGWLITSGLQFLLASAQFLDLIQHRSSRLIDQLPVRHSVSVDDSHHGVVEDGGWSGW